MKTKIKSFADNFSCYELLLINENIVINLILIYFHIKNPISYVSIILSFLSFIGVILFNIDPFSNWTIKLERKLLTKINYLKYCSLFILNFYLYLREKTNAILFLLLLFIIFISLLANIFYYTKITNLKEGFMNGGKINKSAMDNDNGIK